MKADSGWKLWESTSILAIQLSKPLAFIADSILSCLARWLRILGYATAYEKMIKDDVLVERAVHEQRWLLTRDRRLIPRKLLRGRHILIMRDVVGGQLRQLYQDLKIDLDLNHQRGYRCANCNVVLLSISPEAAVPLALPLSRSTIRCFFNALDAARSFGQEPTGSISWID